MKKVFVTMAMALVAVAMMAQQAVITFEKTDHDFGKINEADGKVTTVFTFKNEGMEPLVLSNVRASCGCTTPKWPRQPIEPGQTGEITVTYNPNGRPGRFTKTVTITSNATEPTTRVTIKGEVIPKPAKPVDKYPVKMGELSLKQKEVNFAKLLNTATKTYEIEYANQTDHDITVAIVPAKGQEKYLDAVVTLANVKPQETGKVQIALTPETANIFGPIEGSFLIVVNGKQVATDEYKIIVRADIDEDFSTLSAEDHRNAPILDVAATVNMGNIAAGKVGKRTVSLTNVGADPLKIRRVLNNNKELKATYNKSELKNGKSAQLKLEVPTAGLQAGAYSRQLTLITNDPAKPKFVITINWIVE
ncbi:MAG: DUF1573 domain-containing protein [Paludibacteraceae bacterium]|nr:DUF1573 domain-containing protein [Paludibacteraceae bacterium]